MATHSRIHTLLAAGLACAAALVLVAPRPAAATPNHSHSLSYGWPVKPFDRAHPVRGGFGDPRTVFAGPPSQRTLLGGAGTFQFHNGVDISAPDGTAVYAVESGTVETVNHDWVGVTSSDRSFAYWHVTSSVSLGQHVDAGVTVLGHIIRGCGHVHLSEFDGGVAVNPLAPGHLTPYRDTTKPVVTAIAFRTSVTAPDLMPELLRGRVELIASVHDTPALPVPGIWRDMPVAPALIEWWIRTADTGKIVVARRVAFDVRDRLPSTTNLWDVYARGSHQNMSVFGKHYSYMQPGVYDYRLAPGGFDTRPLKDRVYELVVKAVDIRGNTNTAVQRFSIHNAAGVVGT